MFRYESIFVFFILFSLVFSNDISAYMGASTETDLTWITGNSEDYIVTPTQNETKYAIMACEGEANCRFTEAYRYPFDFSSTLGNLGFSVSPTYARNFAWLFDFERDEYIGAVSNSTTLTGTVCSVEMVAWNESMQTILLGDPPVSGKQHIHMGCNLEATDIDQEVSNNYLLSLTNNSSGFATANCLVRPVNFNGTYFSNGGFTVIDPLGAVTNLRECQLTIANSREYFVITSEFGVKIAKYNGLSYETSNVVSSLISCAEYFSASVVYDPTNEEYILVYSGKGCYGNPFTQIMAIAFNKTDFESGSLGSAYVNQRKNITDFQYNHSQYVKTLYNSYTSPDVIMNVYQRKNNTNFYGNTIQITTSFPPSNLSILINNNATNTSSPSVSLTLYAENVVNCRYKNDSYDWSNFESYVTSKSWTLNETYGFNHTVSYQCNNSAGLSETVTDEIYLIPPECADMCNGSDYYYNGFFNLTSQACEYLNITYEDSDNCFVRRTLFLGSSIDVAEDSYTGLKSFLALVGVPYYAIMIGMFVFFFMVIVVKSISRKIQSVAG